MLYLELYVGSGPYSSYDMNTETLSLISGIDLSISMLSEFNLSLESAIDLSSSMVARIYT